jgi:hypothetical protein
MAILEDMKKTYDATRGIGLEGRVHGGIHCRHSQLKVAMRNRKNDLDWPEHESWDATD